MRRREPEPVPAGRASAASGDRLAGELIGDLDGPAAMVHRDGTVAPLGAGWRVGWAVGAEDRWHVTAQETAVRSRLVDDMPVVETAMRVPGGDVVQRAAAARDGSGRAVVLEFRNGTPMPVSLALALLPAAGRSGADAGVGRAGASGSRLTVHGRIALELGRVPRGAAAVADGEVWRAVRAEPGAGDCEARSRTGRAAAAAVVPLASGVPLRVMLPIEGDPVQARSPDEVAGGWRAVVAQAASVESPDEAAARAWRRGIAASILAAAGTESSSAAARAAVVLDRVGLADEADRGREAIIAGAERLRLSAADAVAALRALASRRLRSGRESGLTEWAGPLASAAGERLDAVTLEQVAAALELEAPAAAADARRWLAELTDDPVPARDARGLHKARQADPAALLPTAPRAAPGRFSEHLGFGGDGLAGIEALLDCLVAEAPDRLVMAPALPAAWMGASVDARSLATRHGALSFSVRWHGPRPAVLWDREAPGPDASDGAGRAVVEPFDGASPDGVTVRCGLDQSWSSAAPAGEALLDSGAAAASL